MNRTYRTSAALLFFLRVSSVAQAPPAAAPRLIEARRPMMDARALLQPLFGRVITYEEPMLSWRDELDSAVQGPRMISKVRSFLLPREAISAPNAAVALDKALEAYNRQATGTRFKVLTSKLGYHVVPAQALNEHGDLVPAKSLLDANVFVAPEERTPEEHLDALGAAITAATGLKLLSAPIPLSPLRF